MRASDNDSTRRSDARFGWWASMATGLLTLLTFGVAVATPPLSGPFCTSGCFDYPYLEIASRFPRDYYWMFLAVPATLAFVAFSLALLSIARPERRLFAWLGAALSGMAAFTIIGDYIVQLAVIQPSVLRGESDGVSMLTQYNPHGIFIALEEMGFTLMSASLACMAPALPKTTRLERAVGRLFAAGFVVCMATLAWFVAKYGHDRSYLFEVSVISIAWLTLIPGSLMMARVFRRISN